MSDHAALKAAVDRAAGRKLSASSGTAHDAAARELADAQRALDSYNAAHSDD